MAISIHPKVLPAFLFYRNRLSSAQNPARSLGPLRAPEGCFRGFLQARDLNLAVNQMFIIGSVFRIVDYPIAFDFLFLSFQEGGGYENRPEVIPWQLSYQTVLSVLG
jgi:hypothetical protein